ncbi:MAG: hypothetical protein R3C60_14235 [Parvularculaceae bacterium]
MLPAAYRAWRADRHRQSIHADRTARRELPAPTGRIIVEAMRGAMPAYVNTGLNFVHVDDVAEGHVLAMEKGKIGERYILGGEDLSLKSLLYMIADIAGRTPPKSSRRRAIFPLAWAAESASMLTGKEPFVTVNGLRLAKYWMYFSSAKAQRELGYKFRPVREALSDAIDWFAKVRRDRAASKRCGLHQCPRRLCRQHRAAAARHCFRTFSRRILGYIESVWKSCGGEFACLCRRQNDGLRFGGDFQRRASRCRKY